MQEKKSVFLIETSCTFLKPRFKILIEELKLLVAQKFGLEFRVMSKITFFVNFWTKILIVKLE